MEGEYVVRGSEDIERAMKRAYSISLSPPSGPVFLSFPMEVMDQESQYMGLDYSTPNVQLLNSGEVERISEQINSGFSFMGTLLQHKF